MSNSGWPSGPVKRLIPVAATLLCFAGATRLVGNSTVTDTPTQAANQVQQPPVLRVTSHLVEVSVVVHDKAGNSVADLKPEDFVVLDQGHPQQIQQFLVSSDSNAGSVNRSLPPNTFSNRIEQRTGETSTATAILLDGLNTKFSDGAYVRGQLVKFLKQLQPGDRVALYGLGRQLTVLHDFSPDSSALIQALTRFQSGPGLQELPPMPRAFQPERGLQPDAGFQEQAFRSVFGDPDASMRAFDTDRRVSITAAALEAIAIHLAGFPGRKNLIWLLGGFPLYVGLDRLRVGGSPGVGAQLHLEEIDRAVRALNRANIVVYPVDAAGLTTVGSFAAHDADLSSMATIADRTGGRLFSETNAVQGAVRAAIDDSRVYYTLGYSPEHVKWDGSYRKIEVKTTRPGLQVRARHGYYALPDVPMDAKQRHQEILIAAVNPLDATTIGVNVQALRSAGGLRLILQVDPRNVRFDEKDGRQTASLDFFYVQRDNTGTVLSSTDQTVNLKLLPETYAKSIQRGLLFEKDLVLVSKTADLRLILSDGGSEALGSVTVPLDRLTPAVSTQ